MRLAVVGAMSLVAALLPTRAFAAPGPVADLTVVPFTSSGSTGVTLSWTYTDPSATGAVMCAKKGDQPAFTPDACDIRYAKSQGETTGSFSIAKGQTYSFSVFAYTASGGQRDYAAPETTAAWDGVRLDFPLNCMTLTYGDPCRFKAALTDTYWHTPASGATVELWRDSTRAGTDQTNDSGQAALALALRQPAHMQWQFQGGDGLLGAFTNIHEVNLAFKLTAHLAKHTAAAGERVKMFGVAAPKTSNRVYIQETITTGQCPGRRRTIGSVVPREQRLPNGQMAYGYVMTLTAGTSGKHTYNAFINRENGINATYTREVSFTVTVAAAATSLGAPTSDRARPLRSEPSLRRLRSC